MPTKRFQPPGYHWTSQTAALALPALIGMLINPLLGLVDIICVGRLSSQGVIDLAALGVCASLFYLAFDAFRATTVATTSLIGRSNSEEERREIVAISLRLGLGLGLCITTILRFSGPWLLGCMGVPSASSPLFVPSRDYLFARSAAAPAVMIAMVAEGAFRGYGDTAIPLLASGMVGLLNLVLDLLLMLPPISMGVKGAGLATAIAQYGALVVYGIWLSKRRMLPQSKTKPTKEVSSAIYIHNHSFDESKPKQQTQQPVYAIIGTDDNSADENVLSFSPSPHSRRGIIRNILGANLAMATKHISLLLAWAYATARATRIGTAHVAAHQVGLSVWLVLALIQDATGVAAQVLLADTLAESTAIPNKTSTETEGFVLLRFSRYHKARSLVLYMARFSIIQGLAATGVLLVVAPLIPGGVVSGEGSEMVQAQLVRLLPHVALQQILVGPTLVAEALVTGGGRFGLLAAGALGSTLLALWQLQTATTLVSIWSQGIFSLFLGRLVTAVLGTVLVLRDCRKEDSSRIETESTELSLSL